MRLLQKALLVMLIGCCVSCGAYMNQPIGVQEARIGESTKATSSLKNLPLPKEPVVVGVYNFRDLTGQYKASEYGSTFSTAVTQGATSILIKALDDSKWFIPIERENIGNLLNERNIIRSTRQEYVGGDSNDPKVPPLLYAGIILEGGIVSYDSNMITGGLGARYFGIGGSTQYRQDRVTIYIRAISTSNGKILKNVYVSKTILSQALDASLFRYVNFQRLLEVETGITTNEPVHLAVTEAIEKGVESLVLEGIRDGLWATDEELKAQRLIEELELEKGEAAFTGIYDRKFRERPSVGSVGLSFGGTLLQGDFSGNTVGYLGKLSFDKPITPHFSANLGGSFLQLDNNGGFQENFAAVDLNAKITFLPNDGLSPYIYGGPGYMLSLASETPSEMATSFPKAQYGGGLEFLLSDRVGLKVFAEHNLIFSDEVDYMVQGKRDDQYFSFGAGINFYLGKPKKKLN